VRATSVPDDTPAALGFRMPAEWEPHAATWLAWPHERSDWPGKFATIPWVYGEVVRHLVPHERVRILVGNAAVERRVRAFLGRVGVGLGRVDFFRVPTDRSWTRDFCPLFVRHADGQVALTNWKFNGWAKYPNWRRDDAVPDRLARLLKRRQWKPSRDGRRIVLEGGSVDVNGHGTLLTTEECLLSPVQSRNPGLERADVERLLGEHLGARKILWLGQGIVGDDTHGHVDDLARFVDPRTVVVAAEEDPTDANYDRLRENRERLERMTDQDAAPLRVVTLPMPAPLHLDGQRLPASYANFYVGNGVVLVPTFNDPRDREALATLAELFPGRRVIGIHAVDLVWGFGTLHCMTQQEPA
jgi:agmatine deiminase